MPLEKLGGLNYSQDRYAKKKGGEGGVCFRLAFKWAAVNLVGGEFRYALDSHGLNVSKTIKKFNAYATRGGTIPADQKIPWNTPKLEQFLAEGVWEGLTYINRWGVTFKDRKGKKFGGVSVESVECMTAGAFLAQVNNPKLTFIYTYSGPAKDGVGTGHATAYSGHRYFDPNHGVYSSPAPTAAGIGADIDAFLAAKETDWNPQRFWVFVLREKD
ncbi:hypothetical protein [Elioraea sp.]|uniref:hypothetical protein n=1 Tax=Elioraea sp. TaxID=2185103 RepID=UPI0025C0383D|nr:hypothetical protein [Elioraea sp.]